MTSKKGFVCRIVAVAARALQPRLDDMIQPYGRHIHETQAAFGLFTQAVAPIRVMFGWQGKGTGRIAGADYWRVGIGSCRARPGDIRVDAPDRDLWT